MIRVTSGKYHGRGVESPPRSKDIRPTTAVMRERLFNRFQAALPGCRFLDLFAGSGIMGLEALSRGASFVLAVDLDADQCRVIQKNYAAIGISPAQAKVIAYHSRKLVARACREENFDIIFIDPPYGFRHLDELVAHCQQNGWLKPGGILIVEHGNRDPDLPGFTRQDYGDTSLSYRISDNGPDGEPSSASD